MPLPERALIDRIRKMAERSPSRAVVRGISDDCAVLRLSAGHELLVTTDFCVENVHFRRAWHPAPSVGHRCLARGLSDIAAMGGKPLACFLSLGLPASVPQRWVDGFLQGLLRLAHRFNVKLAGGDISSAQEIIADIVVTGETPSRKAILRSGARAGDRIYVTGELGGPAAMLHRLFAHAHADAHAYDNTNARVRPATARRYLYPQPRVDVGRWLLKRGLATAMIDISDGLSVDLSHICQESHAVAMLRARDIPVAKSANLELALHGGEDYELLFTAAADSHVPSSICGVKINEIGQMSRKMAGKKDYRAAIQILNENGKAGMLQPQGWEHFRKRIHDKRG